MLTDAHVLHTHCPFSLVWFDRTQFYAIFCIYVLVALFIEFLYSRIPIYTSLVCPSHDIYVISMQFHACFVFVGYNLFLIYLK